jgi:hypothetical protein
MENFDKIYDKVLLELKPSWEEFLIFVKGYGEVELYHKFQRYAVCRKNDDYSFGKSQIWDKSKDYYVFGRYIQEQIKNEQKYETIEQFAAKANINGQLLKNIWNEITNVNCLD